MCIYRHHNVKIVQDHMHKLFILSMPCTTYSLLYYTTIFYLWNSKVDRIIIHTQNYCQIDFQQLSNEFEKNFVNKTGQIYTKAIVKQVLSILTVMQTVALSNSSKRIVKRRNLKCSMHSNSSWSNQRLSLVKHKTPTYTVV